MATATETRPSSSQLRVHVEEDHHHVLAHILNAVGAKRLPLENNVMLHFDSHPDMLLPATFDCARCWDKRALLDAVSIENWILPCAFMGIVTRIVWVRPPWAEQIPRGLITFHIGRRKDSGCMRVTCAENYYASEGIVCEKSELEDIREVRLLVADFTDESDFAVIKSFISEAKPGNLILDVDLDFFSTKNPFLDLYSKANLYHRLKAIYTFDPVPDQLTAKERLNAALSSSESRAQLLRELGALFEHLSKCNSLEGFSGETSRVNLEKVSELVVAVRSAYPAETIDWMLIHDAGSTCDNTDLPHHVSNDEEIDALFNRLSSCLEQLKQAALVPRLVTVARSTEDDFCPAEQVEAIQNRLVKQLQGLYDNVAVQLEYQDQ